MREGRGRRILIKVRVFVSLVGGKRGEGGKVNVRGLELTNV